MQIKHPTIHLTYALVITAALFVASISVQWATISGLADIIGFALSFSSLILAVVAIFQTITSSSQLTDTAASIRRVAEGSEQAIQNVQSLSKELLPKISSLPEALGEVQAQMGRIEAHTISWAAVAVTDRSDSLSLPSSGPAETLARTTYGGLLTFYICAHACMTQRWFSMDQIAKETYLMGFLGSLYATDTVSIFREGESWFVADMRGFTLESIHARIQTFETENPGSETYGRRVRDGVFAFFYPRGEPAVSTDAEP